MLSWYQIATIARIEMKTLLRSWFFRIFTGMALFILILIDLGLLTGVGEGPWMYRGIPAAIPYMNLILLNVGQAVIAAFLASDYLKRDRKLDTTDVIYMRSMTNGDYVFGKTLGILAVFLLLNGAVLMVAFLFNAFFSDVPVDVSAYLLYPLLISVPTLVFILGLSFVCMLAIRNQAVTFILLLGYSGLTLFYLGSRTGRVFDFMAFTLPLMKSDFIGFGNLGEILIHRAMFLVFGTGFISLTVFFFKRLPQSRAMRITSGAVGIACLAAGSAMAVCQIVNHRNTIRMRAEVLESNSEQGTSPVEVEFCDLDVQHGSSLTIQARLGIANPGNASQTEYGFVLNPGLSIRSIRDGSGELSFMRELNIVKVKPREPLSPSSRDTITFSYSGRIDERAAYPDIPDKIWFEPYRFWLFQVPKRISLANRDYLLLTPEASWYPRPVIPYGPNRFPFRAFIRFSLSVRTRPDLTVFSAGAASNPNPGDWRFLPEQRLPQLALIIGRYETRSLTVDSVRYTLAFRKKHDYFLPFFDAIGDTIDALIRSIRKNYEQELGLEYPYPRFSLIEVPVQFYAFKRLWTMAQETVQPEMVLLPEKAVLLDEADFPNAMRREKRRTETTNRVSTPVESQSRLFRRFLSGSVVYRQSGVFLRGGSGDAPEHGDRYSIFPNFYTFRYAVQPDRWPVLNAALESYLSRQGVFEMDQFGRMFTGLTDEEKTNLAFKDQSFEGLIRAGDPVFLPKALALKGEMLFTRIKGMLGEEVFKDRLVSLLESHPCETISEQEFIANWIPSEPERIAELLEWWYRDERMPGFILSEIKENQVLVQNRTRYQVRFTASNPEPVDGLIVVSFRFMGTGPGESGMMGAGSGPFGRGETVEKILFLRGGQSKEFGLVLDASPRMMTVSTMISKNLPMQMTVPFDEWTLDKRAVPFEGEREIPFEERSSKEIVVDNEDTGFHVDRQNQTSLLKKWIGMGRKENEDAYQGIRFWRPPMQWEKIINSGFYGRYVRSACYTRSGEGTSIASWTAMLNGPGYYDVYAYNSQVRNPFGRRRGGSTQDRLGQYRYRIFHDDGSDEAVLDRNQAVQGWNFLGTYYLSSDSARIELSNQCEERMVIADAVKWIKQ